MTRREAQTPVPSPVQRGVACRSRAPRRGRAAVVGLLSAALVGWVEAQVPTPVPLRLVFTRAANTYGNDADVQAAIGKWTEVIGTNIEPGRPIVHWLTDGAEGLVEAFARRDADFGALSPLEFLDAGARLQADPFVTYQANGEVEVSYVLVAGSGIRPIADLRGKRALLHMPSPSPHPARLWLDVELREAGLEGLAGLAEAREVYKPSQALLPVFFGQADVALLPRSSYDTSCELNPDLGRTLHVVAASPPFVKILVVVARRHGPEARARWRERLKRAIETPGARQLFTIFRIESFVPCTLENLANVQRVLERREALERAERQRAKSPRPRPRNAAPTGGRQ
jgi:ABC-type phosphate/phosphonate transport system substrate-binding protein